MTKRFVFVYFIVLSFTAHSQTVDFTFQSTNGLFCNPSTIQFTQTSTGNPTAFIWNLGNGLKSFTATTSTTYINPGTYTIKLIAVFATGAKEITKSIVISPTIKPKITVDRNYICQPGVINFKANSNGNISSYEWDFGDTTGIVNTTTDTIGYNYANYAFHNTILKVTDVNGCFGRDTITTSVRKVPISGSVTPAAGCIPATTSFIANATAPTGTSVTDYAWDYGDGSAISNTTSGNSNHIYTATGTYNATITATTSEGCTNIFNYQPVAFGIPPTNHVAYATKSTICGSETALFIATATNANSYRWNFGDGTSAQVTDTFVKHKYTTLGTKTVTVTPLFNGCQGIPISFPINVVGVIAKFNLSNTCIDKKTFTFTNTSLGNLSTINWQFGDGSPNDTTKNTSHTFPASGQFNTKLVVTDTITGCSDSVIRIIYTGAPILVNDDSAICKYTNTTFNISNNYTNPGATYFWSVVGKLNNSATVDSLKINANILGNFRNYVIINNGSSFCRDTIYLNHNILVTGPQLDFTVPANICFTDTANVVNNSKPFFPSDSVNLWYWNYGNSSINDTVYQPGPILYNSARAYNIKLVGVDINGCKDSLTKRVGVNTLPFISTFPKIDTLCLGQTDSLFAYHNFNIVWSPATSLSCNNCDTVIASPTATTLYTVTATTNFNCSISDSILVKVIPPFTAAAPGTQYICINDKITLDVLPKNKIVTWVPPAGLSNTNIYNPVAMPSQTTTYTATLSDSTGCFTSSADVTVVVKSLPTVDAGPDRFVPYNSPFTISPLYSGNTSTYLWSPSPPLNCTTCATPGGIATTSETYYVTVTSDSGCIATDSIRISIECKDSYISMPKAFTPNGDNLNDYYYPLTRGVKTILKFVIFNRGGQVIFQAQNFTPNSKSFGWDGSYKGEPQQPGAFVYVLEALCQTGDRLTKKGSFLLLR